MPGQNAASAFVFASRKSYLRFAIPQEATLIGWSGIFTRLAMPDDSSNAIQFAGVGFRLPQGKSLLSDLDLAVRTGETFMLVGRSGSGKTTSLKLINRLLTATSGEVRVEGTAVDQWDTVQLRRRIGYAIQDVGLFPHYTVFENVALVPKLERWDGARSHPAWKRCWRW